MREIKQKLREKAYPVIRNALMRYNIHYTILSYADNDLYRVSYYLFRKKVALTISTRYLAEIVDGDEEEMKKIISEITKKLQPEKVEEDYTLWQEVTLYWSKDTIE